MTSQSPSSQYIIVGLSGGVDSAVAALLLKQQGHHVEGLFMKNWEENDEQDCHASGRCTADDDLIDAQAVALKLGIKLHVINFSAEYWDRVFTLFLEEHKQGRTPNPDILCNTEIKFKAFLEHAMELGADYIATGHYAQKKHDALGYHLLKGIDVKKDQSYFLHGLNQSQLEKALFPIGHLTKPEVRAIAQEAEFRNHDKKDSTGICFIGEKHFKQFLSHYLPAQPGPIETVDSKRIGQHDGVMYYTIGQRQGIGIGGLKDAKEEPWYVVAKDLKRNALIVAQGHEHPRLFAKTLIANQLHWINQIPSIPLSCTAKIRYRQPDQACRIQAIEKNQAIVSFDQSQRAITPGQSVVFYQENECLGGGVIVE